MYFQTLYVCSYHSAILCPKISLIHISLNYSIFINPSGFKLCSCKSMKKFHDFLLKCLYWLIRFQNTIKSKSAHIDNVEKLCEVFWVVQNGLKISTISIINLWIFFPVKYMYANEDILDIFLSLICTSFTDVYIFIKIFL